MINTTGRRPCDGKSDLGQRPGRVQKIPTAVEYTAEPPRIHVDPPQYFTHQGKQNNSKPLIIKFMHTGISSILKALKCTCNIFRPKL